MSDKKEITVLEHTPADPENENFGQYRLSNGVTVYFSDIHKIKTDQEAKELVDLIINAQKMRDMLERVLHDGGYLSPEIKELLTN